MSERASGTMALSGRSPFFTLLRKLPSAVRLRISSGTVVTERRGREGLGHGSRSVATPPLQPISRFSPLGWQQFLVPTVLLQGQELLPHQEQVFHSFHFEEEARKECVGFQKCSVAIARIIQQIAT